MISANAKTLHTRLHGLVVFRGLLDDAVVQRMDALLCADADHTVDAWGAFCAALFAQTDNWTSYLLSRMTENENLYVLACCRGGVPAVLEECLSCELEFLQQLGQFDGEELLKGIGSPAWLPRWRVCEADYAASYRARLDELSRKGYGIFAKYSVFTIKDGAFAPVKYPDAQPLSQLSGYERERQQVIDNTRALLAGGPAANVLLYGDAGTGKSSTVKAVAAAYAQEGLRLIEVKKNQLYQIPALIDSLGSNPLKFILFIDDLSFSTNDDDFAALKAILEGSVSGRTANLAVYATSNRRHLIKETLSDREGDDVHLADTMQELMSLSARFGLTITYSRPGKDAYLSIVHDLAKLYDLNMEPEQLDVRAEAHAIRHGGRSPRVAKQFIESLKAQQTLGK